MSKNLQTFPVMKNGEFIGHADARQIAANDSLELFDENKAAAIKAQAEVDASKADTAEKAVATEKAKQAGGADSSAVKKGPASK